MTRAVAVVGTYMARRAMRRGWLIKDQLTALSPLLMLAFV